jgi:hypothetical protein
MHSANEGFVDIAGVKALPTRRSAASIGSCFHKSSSGSGRGGGSRATRCYKHAAVANKQTLDAEVYRLILWSAIKKGRGFDGFFNVWRLRRRIRPPSAPVTFPLAPPDGFTAEQIVLDF